MAGAAGSQGFHGVLAARPLAERAAAGARLACGLSPRSCGGPGGFCVGLGGFRSSPWKGAAPSYSAGDIRKNMYDPRACITCVYQAYAASRNMSPIAYSASNGLDAYSRRHIGYGPSTIGLSPPGTHALATILTAPTCTRRHSQRTWAISGTLGKPRQHMLYVYASLSRLDFQGLSENTTIVF